MAQGFKNDSEAVALWGAAYGDIPKSVFAVMAWHLADCCSGEDGAVARAIEEIEALGLNGIITSAQHKNSKRALERAA